MRHLKTYEYGALEIVCLYFPVFQFLAYIILMPEDRLFDFIFFGLLITLAATLFANWLCKKRKLVRLRREGAAYMSEVTVTKCRPQTAWTIIRAFVTYTDSKGITHTTKFRRYLISEYVRPENLEISATVYVEPYDSTDYAVDFLAKMIKH